jgi:transketolase
MRDAFVRQLHRLAASDPRIFLLTADLGFGVLTDFQAAYPDRFLNVGVAEQNMIGLATGLALEGRVVFAYSIASFATLRCLEQIRNDAAYHGANVKVVGMGGGFSYGALGMSHFATEDVAALRAIPDVTVFTPGTRFESAGATRAAVTTPGTCYLRLDKTAGAEPAAEGPGFQVGKARSLREGTDATIIAMGGILGEAQAAAETLATQGISCRVLSMASMKPFDREAVRRACVETGGIVTVEEHVLEGGLGSAVGEAILDNGAWPRACVRLGIQAGFPAVVGSQEYLRRACSIDAPSIVNAVLRVVVTPPDPRVAPPAPSPASSAETPTDRPCRTRALTHGPE